LRSGTVWRIAVHKIYWQPRIADVAASSYRLAVTVATVVRPLAFTNLAATNHYSTASASCSETRMLEAALRCRFQEVMQINQRSDIRQLHAAAQIRKSLGRRFSGSSLAQNAVLPSGHPISGHCSAIALS